MMMAFLRVTVLVAGIGSLAAFGVRAADCVISGSTVREPAAEVAVDLTGELDSHLPPVIDLAGLAFTSFAPSGLTIIVR